MEEKLKMGFKLIMSGEYGNISGGYSKAGRCRSNTKLLLIIIILLISIIREEQKKRR